MWIIDAHLDLAMNALQMNRDLLQSVYTIRVGEKKVAGKGRGMGTVALPEMRRGRVAVCCATLAARTADRVAFSPEFIHYTRNYAAAWGQLTYYRVLERVGAVRILRSRAELDRHVSEWQSWDAAHPGQDEPAPPPGLILAMEGADPVPAPEDLEEWRDAGVRLLGPAHYGPGRYAGGTGTELGLSAAGEALLRRMSGLGIALDVTHLSDQAFWQALRLYDGTVLASHNTCRALVPHQRAFSDEQFRALIDRDGVIGVAFDDWMLKEGWIEGESSNQLVSLEDVVDHIDHLCQLAGDSRHAGIGTDLDGGYGREQSPRDLDTIADLQRLPELLDRRGFSGEQVADILHGNWLRLFHSVLPPQG